MGSAARPSAGALHAQAEAAVPAAFGECMRYDSSPLLGRGNGMKRMQCNALEREMQCKLCSTSVTKQYLMSL